MRRVTDLLLEAFVVLLLLGGLFLLVWPSCSMLIEASRNVKSANNLKQIGLAIYRFNDANGELPSNSFAANGQPLLSWRVHILPYLEAEDLYRQFHLDEPWDSPNNIKLLDQMPATYLDPRQRRAPAGTTIYRGFSSPGTVFEKRPARHPAAPLLGGGAIDVKTRFNLANFKDPLADTIVAVTSAEPVEWARPDDLDASPGMPFPNMEGLGGKKDFLALMADGSVRRIRRDGPEKVLRALVTHSGGETVTLD